MQRVLEVMKLKKNNVTHIALAVMKLLSSAECTELK